MSEELNINRKKSTITGALSIAVLGVFSTLSQGPLPGLRIGNRNLFDLLDFSSANIMLPLGGLLIVVFAGWFMGVDKVFDELSNGGKLNVRYKNTFLFIIRFVFLNGIGILNFFSGGDL